MKFFKSSNWMLSLWIGSVVLGAVYLLGFGDGQGSPAFVVGQVVLGVIGSLRELYLQRSGVAHN